MKKIFILIALCIAGTITVFPISSNKIEIPLLEMETASPLDDHDKPGDVTPPTRFRATIDGHELFVSANTNRTAHLIVENNSTGDIVEEKTFISSTPLHISQQGDYTLYIISDNTAVVGEFAIK